ncbi:MAG: 23S rRNA (uracil(1939)-C(5))-methyltransferase RlmD [Nitrospirota bacterium]
MAELMRHEPVTVTIEKLVQGGKGLARHDGQVLFVRGAIPAETVAVIGKASKKGYQEAAIRDIVQASPDRVVPPCPVYETCGGCQLQHIRYEAQLELKREVLGETLARVGKLKVDDIAPVIPSPSAYGYRSSVRFTVFRQRSGFALGFHQEGSHKPVEASCCLLTPEAVRRLVALMSERLAAHRSLPVRLETLEVKYSVAFGSILLVCHTGPATREQARELWDLWSDGPNVVGQVVIGRNGARWVTGQDWVADRLGDLIFRISERSFMQANWALNETLSRTVAEWAAPAPGLRVLEVFAGIGTLGLPIAKRGALVTLVEGNPWAVADARHAAKTNHVGRCRFRPESAEAFLETVHSEEYDVTLVDPPRTGLSEACAQGLIRLGSSRLLYLSCDPPTLARDLARLRAGGYQIIRVQPFDMFPQTAHLETLVELVR